MGRSLTVPSKRLCAAATLAAAKLYVQERDVHIAVDVGCDHAKLSIYLIQSGLCSHVYACDIADGPVSKAKNSVKTRTFKGQSLENYIDVVKTDGLSGLENVGANRVFILGMGGEVISDILSKAEFIYESDNVKKIRFILGPMTSQEYLRKFLYDKGFCIDDEILVEDCGRIYTLLSVHYDGFVRKANGLELLFGKHIIEKGGPLFEKQLQRQITICEKAIAQRKAGNLDIEEFEKLYESLVEIKEKKYDNR